MGKPRRPPKPCAKAGDALRRLIACSGRERMDILTPKRRIHMRVFIYACLAAVVIALCSVIILNRVQKPVETAFSTSGVRI
jgi:hypothetical protein